jgi:hypothetical protein
MFNKELYVVIDETNTHINVVNKIQHIDTGDKLDVEHERLIKCFF